MAGRWVSSYPPVCECALANVKHSLVGGLMYVLCFTHPSPSKVHSRSRCFAMLHAMIVPPLQNRRRQQKQTPAVRLSRFKTARDAMQRVRRCNGARRKKIGLTLGLQRTLRPHKHVSRGMNGGRKSAGECCSRSAERETMRPEKNESKRTMDRYMDRYIRVARNSGAHGAAHEFLLG